MRWLKSWKTRTLLIFAVVGPGFITANVDNDAGGIYTYSSAGAQFGYGLLWSLIPITLALIVIQEMCARMGAVTGKGLSDLIREEYGFRATFLMMGLLLAINLMNVVAEFIGVATSMGLFHIHGHAISKYISVPAAALIVWFLVTKGNYKSVEKIFLTASFFYVCYIIAGFLAKPDWSDALRATVVPPGRHEFFAKGYIYMLIATIGTTIAPWMQFYLQASIVEKGVTAREYRASRLDVVLGCVFTDVVAWFIIVASMWRGTTISKTGPTRHAPWNRSQADGPSCSLARVCSTRRCSQLRFCRFPPRTPCVKVWALNPAWTRNSARRPSSTGCTQCWWAPGLLRFYSYRTAC